MELKSLAPWTWITTVLLLAACSSPASNEGGGVAGGTAAGGNAGTAGTSATGGLGGSGQSGSGGSNVCGTSCNDGFSCTLDSCSSGQCQHTIGPNSGPTACPTGQYCTLEKGCALPPACKTAADCEAIWSADACKDNVRCDPASSVCLFDVLDKDGDGHAPQICGGNDCDDSDKSRYPGADEECDGKDNNCDGTVDEQAYCGYSTKCIAGECKCPAENACGSDCVDKSTDNNNCGSCGKVCNQWSQCQNSVCVCSKTQCGNMCTDTTSDPTNCGGCNNACPTDAACENSACVCPTERPVACANACLNTTADPVNCGSCGNKCAAGQTCENSQCVWPCGGSGKTSSPECNTCIKDNCCAQSQACMDDPMCVQLYFCVIECPAVNGLIDTACVQACAMGVPTVSQAYNPLTMCMGDMTTCGPVCPL